VSRSFLLIAAGFGVFRGADSGRGDARCDATGIREQLHGHGWQYNKFSEAVRSEHSHPMIEIYGIGNRAEK
jgi:hypothetical protein